MVFRSICTTLRLRLEDRLHLGNKRKNTFFLCISLDLHYLCKRIMKQVFTIIITLLLLTACGQSYEETKRITRQQRREAARQDSAALKIAVLPTLDCLPLFVAQQEQLLDSLNGGVRLKMFMAQMDCDEAFLQQKVEGMVTDIVRAQRIQQEGMKVRHVTTTSAYWQLLSNRLSRIHKLSQLNDKVVGMTRYSATDMLCDLVADSVKLAEEHLFKVQFNDLSVRMQMVHNNEIDAIWLTEPQATAIRLYKHPVIFDSREKVQQIGLLVFREEEMRHPGRAKQLELLMTAYDKACDLINQHGVKHYKDLIIDRCKVNGTVVDSLPDLKYHHAQGPRTEDLALAEQWLEKVNNARKDYLPRKKDNGKVRQPHRSHKKSTRRR